MKHDPFGNLTDWGMVLNVFEEMAKNGQLAECQPGLIRILRFKGNWRLREEVLKRIRKLEIPSEDLILQVLSILSDDNIYYDARVIAGDTLLEMLPNVQADAYDKLANATRKTVEKLKRTPQPPFFDDALDRLYTQVTGATGLAN
jgi:hypothetical protein